MLLERLFDVAKSRSLRVLLTTHNRALLDATPMVAIADVVACHRDNDSGESKLQRIGDLDDYSGLLAQGPLGFLVASGRLERAMKERRSAANHRAQLALTEAIFRKSAGQ
jgi:hypothetical protein